jgi:hypothetical protein
VNDDSLGRVIYAPPKAGALIEALRGLGYSTATAIADIIDNSIAASALQVGIWFYWDGPESYVAIVDDGIGMTGTELQNAMLLGARNPLETRAKFDLGRFGLGLKTASFSQCRRLTVASKKDGDIACLRWDLDFIAASANDWHLLEGPAPGSEIRLKDLLSANSGTIVLWEMLDRLVSPGFKEQDFLDLIDSVEAHLAMVFHRYLDGPRPAVRITINGRPVVPWDPFLAGQSATWTSPVERFQTETGSVEVQCHVLPHKDRLSQRDYDLAAGPDGWTAQQGFYVYRQRRLLIGGSWLGLGRGRTWTKEEAHRLARIRVDIENTADAAWKIDVRKSTARPPVLARARLTKLAEDTRERARRVFAHRGRAIGALNSEPVVQAWRPEHLPSGMRYRIDEQHPAVRAVIDAAGPLLPDIRAMLKIVEETLPVQRIWLDTAEARDTPRTGFAADPPTEVSAVLKVMYRNLIQRRGMGPSQAREHLLRTEPFNDYPEIVETLPDVPTETD